MTITNLGNGQLRGLSTDTKPTTYPTGSTFFETDTGSQYRFTAPTTWTLMAGGGGSGEINTASNLGTGQGVYKTKSGVDLQFRSLTATSTKIGLANNTNDIGLDVTEANLTHDNIGGTLGIAKGGTGLTTRGDVAIINTDSPYTAPATINTIRADASAGSIEIDLPTASGIVGKVYTIIRTDIVASTNLVTIDPSGTETIDGAVNPHILFTGEAIVIESNGSNWVTVVRSRPVTRPFIRGATANRKIVAGAIGNVANLTNSTTGLLVDKLYATPLIVEKTTQFDLLSFRVNTLSTSGAVRVGIYRDNGNTYPGALIFESGSIDTSTGSTTLTRDTTITASLQIFQPGMYWLTFLTNSITGGYANHGSAAATMTFTGMDPNMGSVNTGWSYNVTHTYGALPDPYPAGAAINITAAATNPSPAVGLETTMIIVMEVFN